MVITNDMIFDELVDMEYLTATEAIAIKWWYGHLKGFEKQLMDIIEVADKDNLLRLKQGFPMMVDAVERVRGESSYLEECKRLAKIHNLTDPNY